MIEGLLFMQLTKDLDKMLKEKKPEKKTNSLKAFVYSLKALLQTKEMDKTIIYAPPGQDSMAKLILQNFESKLQKISNEEISDFPAFVEIKVLTFSLANKYAPELDLTDLLNSAKNDYVLILPNNPELKIKYYGLLAIEAEEKTKTDDMVKIREAALCYKELINLQSTEPKSFDDELLVHSLSRYSDLLFLFRRISEKEILSHLDEKYAEDPELLGLDAFKFYEEAISLLEQNPNSRNQESLPQFYERIIAIATEIGKIDESNDYVERRNRLVSKGKVGSSLKKRHETAISLAKNQILKANNLRVKMKWKGAVKELREAIFTLEEMQDRYGGLEHDLSEANLMLGMIYDIAYPDHPDLSEVLTKGWHYYKKADRSMLLFLPSLIGAGIALLRTLIVQKNIEEGLKVGQMVLLGFYAGEKTILPAVGQDYYFSNLIFTASYVARCQLEQESKESAFLTLETFFEKIENCDTYSVSKNQAMFEFYKKSLSLMVYLASELDKPDIVLKYTEESLKHEPNNPRFLNNYAWILMQFDRLKEAEKYVRQALKLEDDSGETWDTLANILEKQGKEKEAEVAFKKAKELGSDT
ncbi:MAG: hypothetical protein GOP50_07750 [Candidatus Heimdallarchaeota archaeon]|nr:hypothetical protein [Candidatus Heimdallarchaeota archaeon]